MKIDLGDICEKQMNEIVSSGYITEQIRISLEKTIKSAIESELEGYNGEVKKSVTECVKKSLQFDPEKIDIPLYNKFITAVVKESLDNFLDSECKDKIKSSVEKILTKEIKPKYTLEEIIEEFKSYESEYKDYDDEMTLHIRETTYGSYHVYMDDCDNKDILDCEISFAVDKSHQYIYGIQIRNSCKDSDCINTYGFEKFLQRLSAYESKVIINSTDSSDYDLSYCKEDY
ncbi:MAG: hypothetical protein ACI4JK_03130 [Oscillospiraceae bacterium]